jgi:small subunit ribosomal protein S18
MAKVFVGNFSFTITEEQLREYFSTQGEVTTINIMKDPVAQRSRGFGFIEFKTKEQADNAIKELDGQVWEGRALKVSEDRSNSRRGPDGGGSDDYISSRSSSAPSPMGFFRAQPLEIGLKKKKKPDPFMEDEELKIDYKDGKLLCRFMSERGRILPRRMTGLNSHNQRLVTKAIKRARNVGILPYVAR